MDEITEDEVEIVSDEIDPSEAFEDEMCEYLEVIADVLAEKHSMTTEERDKLLDRLAWRLVLLPSAPAD